MIGTSFKQVLIASPPCSNKPNNVIMLHYYSVKSHSVLKAIDAMLPGKNYIEMRKTKCKGGISLEWTC